MTCGLRGLEARCASTPTADKRTDLHVRGSLYDTGRLGDNCHENLKNGFTARSRKVVHAVGDGRASLDLFHLAPEPSVYFSKTVSALNPRGGLFIAAILV